VTSTIGPGSTTPVLELLASAVSVSAEVPMVPVVLVVPVVLSMPVVAGPLVPVLVGSMGPVLELVALVVPVVVVFASPVPAPEVAPQAVTIAHVATITLRMSAASAIPVSPSNRVGGGVVHAQRGAQEVRT
jgi:hypothetical protein